LDLAIFNAAFAPARTDYDWLSRDEAQVDAYLADPRCGFGLDIDATKAMFAAARAVADPHQLAHIRSDLPLYLGVGEQDPVNGQLALVHALVARYQAAGLTDITLKTYPGARHEVFNEANRAEVVADLLTWLDRVAPS
jgi:alpha-beta hydrolase superfamily lysophospholipase